MATCTVVRESVVAVLSALRFNKPDTWPDDKVVSKLKTLGAIPKIKEAVAKIEDKPVRAEAERLLVASLRNESFEVTDEETAEVEEEANEVADEEAEVEEESPESEEAEAEEPAAEAGGFSPPEPPTPAKKETKKVSTATKTTPKAAPAQAKKPAAPAAKTNPKAPPAKPAAKPKAEAAPKKETTAKDAFGMRLGTRAARINAAISATPQSPKEIMLKAKYDKPIHGHLKKLLAGGFVQVDAEGNYSLKGAKPAAKKPAAAPAKKVVVAKK